MDDLLRNWQTKRFTPASRAAKGMLRNPVALITAVVWSRTDEDGTEGGLFYSVDSLAGFVAVSDLADVAYSDEFPRWEEEIRIGFRLAMELIHGIYQGSESR